MTFQEAVATDVFGDKKPKGSRGSFFATFDGESIPCVSEHWKDGLRYSDPGAKPSWRRWIKYFGAIRDGQKVILTRQKDLGNGSFKRTGYSAIYSVSECSMSENGLEFSFGHCIKEFD
jgi:hypothetical protein